MYGLNIKIPLYAREKFAHRILNRYIIQYLIFPLCENSWVEAIHLYENVLCNLLDMDRKIKYNFLQVYYKDYANKCHIKILINNL